MGFSRESISEGAGAGAESILASDGGHRCEYVTSGYPPVPFLSRLFCRYFPRRDRTTSYAKSVTNNNANPSITRPIRPLVTDKPEISSDAVSAPVPCGGTTLDRRFFS